MRFHLKRLQRRLRYALNRRARRDQLREEMEVHLEALARDFMEGGMSADDSRAAARRQFGNATMQA